MSRGRKWRGRGRAWVDGIRGRFIPDPPWKRRLGPQQRHPRTQTIDTEAATKLLGIVLLVCLFSGIIASFVKHPVEATVVMIIVGCVMAGWDALTKKR